MAGLFLWYPSVSKSNPTVEPKLNRILAQIDSEIDRLTQARNLLSGTFNSNGHHSPDNGHAPVPVKRGPGRPPNSSKVVPPAHASATKNGTWQSTEFREKMRRIAKANWKKRRQAERAAKAA